MSWIFLFLSFYFSGMFSTLCFRCAYIIHIITVFNFYFFWASYVPTFTILKLKSKLKEHIFVVIEAMPVCSCPDDCTIPIFACVLICSYFYSYTITLSTCMLMYSHLYTCMIRCFEFVLTCHFHRNLELGIRIYGIYFRVYRYYLSCYDIVFMSFYPFVDLD